MDKAQDRWFVCSRLDGWDKRKTDHRICPPSKLPSDLPCTLPSFCPSSTGERCRRHWNRGINSQKWGAQTSEAVPEGYLCMYEDDQQSHIADVCITSTIAAN